MTPEPDPIAWFQRLHREAAATESFEPDRAALATADASGRPSVRYVLVRRVDERGFAFFTHYESRKAAELARGFAALAYHWASTGVQVRVAGRVEKLPSAESDAYFHGRPRGSQVGAWASPQSQPLPDRDALERSVAEAEARFAEGDVPRPAVWGGYLVVPERMEMWFARESRLHDRFEYQRDTAGWTIRRLAP